MKEISKSWRAKAHRASLALVGVEAVRKVKGLWSEYRVVLDIKIQFLNFFKAKITAYASRSTVDQRA